MTAHSTEPLQHGQTLRERYLIMEKVGEGGMGIVYKALDQDKKVKCAIKTVHKIKLKRQGLLTQAISLFEEEANILRKLDHENIVKILDYFWENDLPYIVMEFIKGSTLEEIMVISEQGLNVKRVSSIAMQLCNALDYLHQLNPTIICRDIKPDNIMMQKKDEIQIKLIDFGVARSFKEGNTRDTYYAGTAQYMSPEAIERNRQTDHRSDIYSLGMTLYYLLTADQPPTGRKEKKEFNPMIELSKYDCYELNELIKYATKYKPEERWQSAHDMLQALLGKNNKKPVSTVRDIVTKITKKILQLSNRELAVFSVTLISIVTGLTWLLGSWIQQEFSLIWQYFPFYYAIGPFAYAVSNRQGSAAIVHFILQLVTGSVTRPNLEWEALLLVAIVSAFTMEVVLNHLASTIKSKILRCMIATALAVSLLWIIPDGDSKIHPLPILGGGLAGYIAYYASEGVLGVYAAHSSRNA